MRPPYALEHKTHRSVKADAPIHRLRLKHAVNPSQHSQVTHIPRPYALETEAHNTYRHPHHTPLRSSSAFEREAADRANASYQWAAQQRSAKRSRHVDPAYVHSSYASTFCSLIEHDAHTIDRADASYYRKRLHHTAKPSRQAQPVIAVLSRYNNKYAAHYGMRSAYHHQ